MARGTTLDKLLFDLRVACRLSINASHNVQYRDAQVQALQRKQEFYWDDFAWPHLRVDRYLQTQAGQRYYDLPNDLDVTRISHVQFRADSVDGYVYPGIDNVHYAAFDSDLGVRSWPVQRWQLTENETIELWPIPNVNYNPDSLEGRLKVTGIRKLKPLVSESDRADLDDQLLIQSCAADYLGAQGAKDAQLKLDQVNRYYAKLRGQLMPRRKFTIGQDPNYSDRRIVKVPIAVFNKTS